MEGETLRVMEEMSVEVYIPPPSVLFYVVSSDLLIF